MNQSQLGKAVGITFQQVQKYENRKNRISASELYRFASVLGVPVSFFFEGVEPKPHGGPRTARQKFSHRISARLWSSCAPSPAFGISPCANH
ncbi:MAG TPA: helix-turn-helix transcriptional regulator [Alphaproteobacteria bacterium]|nr:helix-turn-helix transcriptional regulator [Alphaproteobacteria bacterium]